MTERIGKVIQGMRCQRWAFELRDGNQVHDQCKEVATMTSIVAGRLTLKTCEACHAKRVRESREDDGKRG